MKLTKEDFNSITKLYMQQEWLLRKDSELKELISFCESKKSKELIYSLLHRFYYLNTDKLNYLYNQICDFVIKESGFSEEKTQLLSLTYDDDADSSQKIIDNIKVNFFKAGWRSIKTVNMFGKGIPNHRKGKTQILIIDEFIGSGKTLKIRLDYLSKNIGGEYEVKCCFVAGMKESIEEFQKQGIDIFCPLQLDKGLSGFYNGQDLIDAEEVMFELELKLAQNINTKDLYNYSCGYGNAQALYTMEGCNGNTPNSVFPIFWWLRDNNDKDRNTLLTRYELGF